MSSWKMPFSLGKNVYQDANMEKVSVVKLSLTHIRVRRSWNFAFSIINFLQYFHLFKQTIQILKQIYVKNVHRMYLALGFEPMTTTTWVFSHNHKACAPLVSSVPPILYNTDRDLNPCSDVYFLGSGALDC